MPKPYGSKDTAQGVYSGNYPNSTANQQVQINNPMNARFNQGMVAQPNFTGK
jgi:hypothetical protein